MNTFFSKRVHFRLTLGIVLLVLCAYFSGVGTTHFASALSGAPCHVYNVGSSIPTGFAAPWDVFAKALLMKVFCGTGAELTVSGTPATYIWKTAYTAVLGGSWATVPLVGSNTTPDGNWLIGNASANLSTATADMSKPNFALVYICTYADAAWKCGCSFPSSCIAGNYSIQRFTSTENTGNGSATQCSDTPLDIQIVIDHSGSMSGDKIRDAKASAKTFIDVAGGSNTRMGMLYFNSSAYLTAGLTPALDTVKDAIDRIRSPNSSTNVGLAIGTAHRELEQNGNPSAKHVILLLTDGKANLPLEPPGPDRDFIPPDELPYAEQYAENEAARAKAAGNILYVVGMGSDVNTASLRRMATSPSHYYFAPTSAQLESIYVAIAGRLCPRAGAILSGLKLIDKNGNGARDAGDTGLSSWTIVLKDQSGSEKARTLTNASGAFSFRDVSPGTYSVCEITGTLWRQTLPPSGCHSVTVGAQNVGGLLFLNTPQLPTLMFTADALTVPYDTSTTLRWTAQNVSVCIAGDAWSGGKSLSGIESTGNLTASKTYTLTCTGARGSVAKSVTVGISVPPPEVTLSASATKVSRGANSTLTWTSQNASACAASSGTPDWPGAKVLNGSQLAGPINGLTTFIITCTNAGGSTTRSVSVDILPIDFALVNQGDIEVQFSGTSGKTTTETVITVLPREGFSGTVALSAGPSVIGGVAPTFNFSDAALSSAEYSTGSRFSIAFPSSIAPGNYAVQVTGVSGSLIRATNLTLKVTNFNPVIIER